MEDVLNQMRGVDIVFLCDRERSGVNERETPSYVPCLWSTSEGSAPVHGGRGSPNWYELTRSVHAWPTISDERIRARVEERRRTGPSPTSRVQSRCVANGDRPKSIEGSCRAANARPKDPSRRTYRFNGPVCSGVHTRFCNDQDP